jgi:hypothetical protein
MFPGNSRRRRLRRRGRRSAHEGGVEPTPPDPGDASDPPAPDPEVTPDLRPVTPRRPARARESGPSAGRRDSRASGRGSAIPAANGGAASEQRDVEAGIAPDLRPPAREPVERERVRDRVLDRERPERGIAVRRRALPDHAVNGEALGTRDRPLAFPGRRREGVAVSRGEARQRRPTEEPEPGVSGNGEAAQPPSDTLAESAPNDPPSSPHETGLESAAPLDRSGLVPGVLAGLCFALVIATSRMNAAAVGRVLIPLGAISAAVAFGQVLARRHPDEPWLPKLLVAAVVVKLGGSILRFYALVNEHGFHGDSSIYDKWGQNLFDAWTSGGAAPDPYTGAGAGTGWVRWFTGAVYYAFGPDMLNGFLLFGLLALVGSYLWYRAAADAVPFLNKRVYFLLVFFVPSIAFWPSSIGKEALMLLGLGVVALGTARLLMRHLLQGILLALPGGWLLWRVRPHLLAFATFAAGAAYVFGRVRRGRARSESTSIFKPVGMVIVVLLAFFALSQAADFLGMDDFSISSIEQELNQQTGRTAQGGSKVETGETRLTPLSVPQGLIKVLLQPFPWEVETSLQILASLESAALGLFILYRIRSVILSLTRARSTPFLIYCWTLVLLYAVAFSAVANYGLLTRQRSLALPALFVLLAVEPALAKRKNSEDQSSTPQLGVRGAY